MRINNSITKIAVWVESYPELSEAIQKIAFTKGYSWKKKGTEVSHLDKPILTFNFNTKKIASHTDPDGIGRLKPNPCQLMLNIDTELSHALHFLYRTPKLFDWVEDGEVSVNGNVAEVVEGGIQIGCSFVPRDDVFRIANMLANDTDIAKARSAFKLAGEEVLEGVE